MTKWYFFSHILLEDTINQSLISSMDKHSLLPRIMDMLLMNKRFLLIGDHCSLMPMTEQMKYIGLFLFLFFIMLKISIFICAWLVSSNLSQCVKCSMQTKWVMCEIHVALGWKILQLNSILFFACPTEEKFLRNILEEIQRTHILTS